MRMHHFWAQSGSFTPIFYWKKLLSFSSTHRPFHCAKFKNQFLQQMQSYEDAPFLGPK